MGHLIQKTGEDQYRVWSTVVDGFVIEEATAKELEEWYVAKAIKAERERVQARIAEANDPVEAARDAQRFRLPPPGSYVRPGDDA